MMFEPCVAGVCTVEIFTFLLSYVGFAIPTVQGNLEPVLIFQESDSPALVHMQITWGISPNALCHLAGLEVLGSEFLTSSQ